MGSNPARRWSFSAVPYFSLLRLSCRKMGARPRKDFVSPKIGFVSW